LEIIMSFESILEGLGSAAGKLFRGSVDATAYTGGYVAGYGINKVKDTFAVGGVGHALSGFGQGISKNVFHGTMAGLGVSAVGLGLRGVFGNDSVQEQGPGMSALKGGIAGAAVGAGFMGVKGIHNLFGDAAFRSTAGALSSESGLIGRGILGAGRFAGSRFGLGVMAGAVGIGGGTMLMKSIISTNFTQAR
jgi:hypothetical protein